MSETRRALVLGLRIGGVALMLLGLYMWLGGSIAGGYGFGTILVAMGLLGTFALPWLIARRR